MVLSLGSIADGDDKSCELYQTLASAAICLRSLQTDSTMWTFLALFLMVLYEYHRGPRGLLNRRWSLLGMCSSIAFRLGLHQNRVGFDLDAEECSRRTSAFQEFQMWSLLSVSQPLFQAACC
jgi:hypothetical protein